MFKDAEAYSGFSVDDIPAAKAFYADTLGLEVAEHHGMLTIRLGTGATVLAYPKGDQHVPAEFTILNFPVDDIDQAVDALASKGIEVHKDGPYSDEKGILRGKSQDMGPDIAWFSDPAGNTLSVLDES